MAKNKVAIGEHRRHRLAGTTSCARSERGRRTTKARPKTINEAKGTFRLSRTGTI